MGVTNMGKDLGIDDENVIKLIVGVAAPLCKYTKTIKMFTLHRLIA